MAFESGRFNYDKASEADKAKALFRNQTLAAQRAAAFARSRAGAVQTLGGAAVRGGKFEDISAAPGYQNPYTGAVTNLLMQEVTDPYAANLRGTRFLNLLRKKKPYVSALNKLDEKTTGGYISVLNPPDPTGSGAYSEQVL